MTVNTSEQTSLDLLITLKSQYEYALTEANAKAVYLREQLAHVNALLINQLIPSSNGAQPLQANVTDLAPMLALSAQIETLGSDFSPQLPSLEVAEPISVPRNTTTVTPRKQKRAISKIALKVAPKPEKPASKRHSLSLLPTYQGLQKLEAIAQVLKAAAGQEVTIDSVVQTLYGNLSAAEHKAERFRMKTAMFQGVKKGFWQKAATPSSYLIPAIKGRSSGQKAVKASLVAKAEEAIALAPESQAASRLAKSSKTKPGPVAGTNKRNSLPLLPVYQDMKKLDAIGVVLENYRGEVLHHDTIIQMLYGDLSPAELKAERVRIKTALLTGVKNNRWEKAPKPSSYFIQSEVATSRKARGAKAPKK
jgi:hypothetical protein